MPRPKLSIRPEPSRLFPGNDFANADLDPVPLPVRTWTWYNVSSFWIAEGFQIPILQTAGSIVASGLSPGMAMGSIVLGTCLVMVPCALSGYMGARTGLNFPGVNRAAWGLHGSKAAVAIRAIVAVFWYGVQISTGGDCVYRMLKAIWPSLDSRVPNALPESANITSVNLLCFFIFWLASLPFLWIHISKLRWLFLVKMVIMPIGGLALFIWSLVTARDFGPVFDRPTHVSSGRSVAFVFFTSVTSTIGPQATFALNMGDLCRFAKSPRAALWSQVVMMPVCITLTAFLGVVLATSATVIYDLDEVPWNPLDVVGMFDSRAAAFFVALMFAFATLCTNLSANSVAFGNDLGAILPKYIDIRRGQFICAVLGVCVTPWNILASAGNFLTFLNGYSVFLGPLCGILLTDYLLVRGEQLNITHLYMRDGVYYYTKGWNLRALGAFLLAVVPNLPGLAAAVNARSDVPEGFENMYTMNWLVGVVIASTLCYVAYKFWPIRLWNADESVPDVGKDYLMYGLAPEGLDADEIKLESVEIPDKV